MSILAPWLGRRSYAILVGDATAKLRELPAESFRCCVTSPPYWGLRDYGMDAQIGLEQTPEDWVAALVGVFREVRRVLADDGTLWVNCGDCYVANKNGNKDLESSGLTTRADGTRKRDMIVGGRGANKGNLAGGSANSPNRDGPPGPGYKCKDLISLPWMLAFALRADGWYLRGDHVWAKPNGMPESVTDRPTRSHEYVFVLSKSARYFYDEEAVRTAPKASTATRLAQDVESQNGSHRANGGEKTNGTMKAVRRTDKQRGHSRRHAGFNDRWDESERTEQQDDTAQLRSVWWISPGGFKEAHFAVMPERVAEICVRAGSAVGDAVVDPFAGSGTVGAVACPLCRLFIGTELNPEYAQMAERRIRKSLRPQTARDEREHHSPLFNGAPTP